MPISNPPTYAEMSVMYDLIHLHSISYSTFGSLIYGFYGKLPNDPSIRAEERPETTILTSLKDKEIADKISLIVSGLENEPIIFMPAIEPPDPGEGGTDLPVSVSTYSVGLLIGLASIYPGSTFKFYKAVKFVAGEGAKNTSVFSVHLNGKAVYFGDLSEAHP